MVVELNPARHNQGGPGYTLVPFDRIRDSFSREIFLTVLGWDLDLADVNPPDPEMWKKISEEPLVYQYPYELDWAPELEEVGGG